MKLFCVYIPNAGQQSSILFVITVSWWKYFVSSLHEFILSDNETEEEKKKSSFLNICNDIYGMNEERRSH